MPRSKTEAAKSKVESALALGGLGASLGGPIGGGLGAVTGLIIGDNGYVFPLDMVAIPAFEAYKIQGSTQFMIYIKQGETLMPTGGEVLDAQPLTEVEIENLNTMTKPKKRKTAYQRRYQKAFKSIAPKHKLKNGKWKKADLKQQLRQHTKKQVENNADQHSQRNN